MLDCTAGIELYGRPSRTGGGWLVGWQWPLHADALAHFRSTPTTMLGRLLPSLVRLASGRMLGALLSARHLTKSVSCVRRQRPPASRTMFDCYAVVGGCDGANSCHETMAAW